MIFSRIIPIRLKRCQKNKQLVVVILTYGGITDRYLIGLKVEKICLLRATAGNAAELIAQSAFSALIAA